tara:strand:+ start:88 stop:1551 length:1464 start_codon:yes stop_codon:yes gene_type:complete
MTVVNPKSISGINSITTGSGSDNLLTIHTSDANNTERLRIDSTGATKIVTGIVTTLTATTGIVTTLTTNTLTANSTAKVGSGVTLSPDGDVFATGVTTCLGTAVLGNTIVGAAVTITSSGIEASGIGITVANINGTQIGGRRNIVINGGMTVAQRGTSFTSTGSEFTIDRFRHEIGSSFNFDTTTTQSSDHPDGFKNSLKITPDSVVTPSGSENGAIRYQIEGQDVQQFAHGTSSAKPMTLSFYAKSASQNSGHVYSIQIRKYDPSDSRKYVLKPFTVTDSWQRFSFTFIGDTATAIVDTTAQGMELAWQLSCGPDDLVSATETWTSSTKFQGVSGQNNFMDNTNNHFYLTGVQLEIGSQATAFEHRSFGEENRLCKRYFQRYVNIVAVGYVPNNGSKSYSHGFVYPVEMRSSPTLAITTTGSSQGQACTDGQNTVYVTSLLSSGRKIGHLSMSFNLSGDLTDYRGAYLVSQGSTANRTEYTLTSEI